MGKFLKLTPPLLVLIAAAVAFYFSFQQIKTKRLLPPAAPVDSIVFLKTGEVKEEGSQGTIWLMDKDGTNQRSLNQGAWELYGLSPDRRFTLFNYKNNIWKIGADGSNLRQLSKQGRKGDNKTYEIMCDMAKWSRDGSLISYSVRIVEGMGVKEMPKIDEGTWVANSDGTNQRVAVKLTSLNLNLGLLPNNKSLLFYREGGTWIKDIDGKGDRLFISMGNYYPEWPPDVFWSPKGDRGIFIALQKNDSQIEVSLNLIDPDGKKIKEIFKESRTDLADTANNGWSPDGKKYLYYQKFDDGRRRELAMINVDTGERRILTQDVTLVQWLSDNKTIIIAEQVGNRSGLGDLYSLDIETLVEKPLTTTGGKIIY